MVEFQHRQVPLADDPHRGLAHLRYPLAGQVRAANPGDNGADLGRAGGRPGVEVADAVLAQVGAFGEVLAMQAEFSFVPRCQGVCGP